MGVYRTNHCGDAIIFRTEENKKMKKGYTAACVWNHPLWLIFIEHLQKYPEDGLPALGVILVIVLFI